VIADAGQSVNNSGHSVPTVCSEQPWHVLEEHDGSCFHSANESADVVKEPSVIVYSFALTSERYGLAGEPCGENVDGGKFIKGGEVAKVGSVNVGFKPGVCSVVNVGDKHCFGVDAC
jgi:hypothetical protein